LSTEWTFEEAKKRWKPMAKAVQHVGVPGHQWQAAVLWDGSIVCGPIGHRGHGAMVEECAPLGDNLLYVLFGYGEGSVSVDRRGLGSDRITRGLEDGRLPIPHIEIRDGDLIWSETVFAHLLGREMAEGMEPRPDDVLVVRARFRVRNTGEETRKAQIWMHFGEPSGFQFGYKVTVPEELGKPVFDRFEGVIGMAGDEARFALLAGGDVKLVAEGDGDRQTLLGRVVSLEPGEEARHELIIPYRSIDPEAMRSLLVSDSDKLYEEAKTFWRELVSGWSEVVTPDEFVNDYAAAVVGQMAQQTGRRHKTNLWMYKTSPNHYECYWPCNAAKALPTLDLRGLSHISRPVLRSFIDFQSEDVGALTRELRRDARGERIEVEGEGFGRVPGFLGNFGDWTANTLLLSHGLELWALASHYRITRDSEWLGRGPGTPLQAILDGCDWLAAQRRRTMREEDGRKVPHWGLLPAASAHDWLSGNTIFNDAFCIFGMIEAVRLLRETDHPRAEEITQELNAYRACLRERYVEARDRARPVPLPDGSELPYVPRDVGEPDWATVDWTCTGYGPLRAGAWGALDPHDELVDQALAFLEAGMPQGEGPYINIREGTADENWRDISDPEATRHYLWRNYVEYETMWPIGTDLFLQRDDLPRFFEFLFNNLAVVLHHEWRVGVESLDGVPSCAPGDGERWRMIRNMFVNERGGHDGSQQSLWLLQAIPRSWLKPGAVLSAKSMRTHFGGSLDLEMMVSGHGGAVEVAVKHDLAVVPAEIRVRLRSGDGSPIVSAKINGEEVPVADDDTIQLPTQTKGDHRIEAVFGR